MLWLQKHPLATPDMLGFLPGMLSEEDLRPSREQLDSAYQHGGGWRPVKGFTILPDGSLSYPGDPPMPLLWETTLRDETIRFYFGGPWVAIIQPNGTFEICRMD